MWIGIERPKLKPSDPSRSSECQQALWNAFHELRTRAEKAGWDRHEVDWAIMLLAGADLKQANANRHTADALEGALSTSPEPVERMSEDVEALA